MTVLSLFETSFQVTAFKNLMEVIIIVSFLFPMWADMTGRVAGKINCSKKDPYSMYMKNFELQYLFLKVQKS